MSFVLNYLKELDREYYSKWLKNILLLALYSSIIICQSASDDVIAYLLVRRWQTGFLFA